MHHTTGPVHVQGSVYYSRFSNFIYQAPTGEVRDGLPVYGYHEGKANYYGFELQGDARFGKALGIDNKWAYNAIKSVGNYGEIFERNLGANSPLKLDRGINDLWTRGGRIYALPIR